MKETSPRFSFKLLKWFCPDHLYEELSGDLIQRYERDLKEVGDRKARRKLFWNTIRFFRPGIIFRSRGSFRPTGMHMIKNYIVIAARIFTRQKTYSAINISGLSVGLACSLLISIYLLDELSYDKGFQDADRIYRVGITEKFQGEAINYTDTQSGLAEAMRNEIPEIESSVRITRWSKMPVRFKEQGFSEDKFYVADSNFFQFFGLKLIEGNLRDCLAGPNKIVLTETAAKKYFDYQPGGNAAIGKSIELGFDRRAAEVTGIIADPPSNVHFKYDFIYSADSWSYAVKDDCWGCYGVHTYFKLRPGGSLAAVEEILEQFVEKRVMPDIGTTLADLKSKGDNVHFFIHPLTSIHLESHNNGEFEANGDSRYVYIFGAIAIFIVLIACINFMNLATAQASNRAKEVGIRKTVGALKSWLMQQFMVESFLYVLVSAVFSLLLCVAVLQPFNELSGKNFHFDFFHEGSILGSIGIFIVVVGLLAGTYPAFYLTAFKPIEVITGKARGVRRSLLRNGLVIFQFAISMGLIISTLVIYKQLKLISDKNLGFDRENIIAISQTEDLGKNRDAFKTELLRHPDVVNAGYAGELPPNITSTLFVNTPGSQEKFAAYMSTASYDAMETMGYALKSGRFFSREIKSDSLAVILNENCAKLIGYESVDGRYVTFGGSNQTQRWNVVGIVKDFSFEGLREQVKPLVIFLTRTPRFMAIRLTPGETQRKIELVESIWDSFQTGLPLQYSFIDEDVNAMFQVERKMGKIFWVFTVIAIFIACLGLFGLITFTAAQRTKEIGIRKVMGASVSQVAVLLSKNLLRLVIISFAFAVPITWYSMDLWLQSFPYRANVDLVIVLIACAAGSLIAILTVSYKAYRAAATNPIESLRSE